VCNAKIFLITGKKPQEESGDRPRPSSWNKDLKPMGKKSFQRNSRSRYLVVVSWSLVLLSEIEKGDPGRGFEGLEKEQGVFSGRTDFIGLGPETVVHVACGPS